MIILYDHVLLFCFIFSLQAVEKGGICQEGPKDQFWYQYACFSRLFACDVHKSMECSHNFFSLLNILGARARRSSRIWTDMCLFSASSRAAATATAKARRKLLLLLRVPRSERRQASCSPLLAVCFPHHGSCDYSTKKKEETSQLCTRFSLHTARRMTPALVGAARPH